MFFPFLFLTDFTKLKNAYNGQYDLYMVSNPDKKLNNTWLKSYSQLTANMSKAVSGFRVVGIHPTDPDKFKESFENLSPNVLDLSQIQVLQFVDLQAS